MKTDLLKNQLYGDNWPKRRRWMTIILLWAMANVQYLVIWGSDTGLHQNALVAIIGLIAAVVGSYFFGSTWDDHGKRECLREDQSFDEVKFDGRHTGE